MLHVIITEYLICRCQYPEMRHTRYLAC